MKNEDQLEGGTDLPKFYPGLLTDFFNELEGEDLQIFLDECRELLATQIIHEVGNKNLKGIKERLDREGMLLDVITTELLNVGIQPPPD
jgi:hypothetical protein